MKTISIAVDDGVYAAAESAAARLNASVNTLVLNYLVGLGSSPVTDLPQAEAAESEQRLRLVDLLEQCQIDLTERPTREATYAHRRFH